MQSSRKITRNFIEDYISGTTQTALNLKADDNSVLHNTGSQLLNGQLTISSLLGYGLSVVSADSSGAIIKGQDLVSSALVVQNEVNGPIAQFRDADGINVALINYLGEYNGSAFVKSGGLSTEFLKADGSVDSTVYQALLTDPVTGTGIINFVPRWNGINSQTSSDIYNAGSNLVGIGTTNPRNSAGFSNLTLENTIGGSVHFRSAGATEIGGLVGRDNGLFLRTLNLTTPIFFAINDIEKMRVSVGGNILMGTLVDDGVNKLQVNGSATIGNLTSATHTINGNASGTTTALVFKNSGTSIGLFGSDAAILGGLSTDIGIYGYISDFYIGSNSTKRLIVKQAGNVLIGTTTDNVTDKLQVNGSLIATTLKKSGGLSSQFLKADGSSDSTVYATDSLAMHLAGNETFTGTKSFNVTSLASPALNITNNLAGATSQAIIINNTNSGKGIVTTNTSSGTIIDMSTTGTGTGLNIACSNLSSGLVITGSGPSTSLFLNNTSSGTGAVFQSSGSATGTALHVNNQSATSKGLTINNISGSTRPFQYLQVSVERTFITDNGNITAPAFIKTGGLATEFLKANGSSDSTVYNSGTGTTNTLAKYTGTNTTGNSTITDNGSIITLGSNTTITTGNLTFGSTLLSEKLLQMNNASLSTGLYNFASGGITMASATEVNIGAVQGWIVDSDDHLNSNPTFVNYAGTTNLTPTFIGSAAATYFLITPGSTLLQLNTRPTVTQRRDNIFLGVIGHPAGTLTGIGNSPDIIMNYGSQLRAMFEPTKLINEGVVPYAGAADLSLYNTAGKLYGLGIGFIANGNDAPSLINVAGGAPMTTQYRTSVGIPSVGGTNRTTAVPDRYESGGVDIAIPGSSNQATNQRIYLLQNGVIRFQYGQTLYATLADAIAGATNEAFVVNINAINLGILIGILSIQKGATNLQNTAQARFLPVSKFGETVGAAAGISIGTLQTAYNNSANPEIVTNSTLGAITIRRGSAADTDNVLEIQNGAASTTASVNGNGKITGTSIVKSGGTSAQYLLADGSTTSRMSNQSIASQTLTATTRTYVTGSNLVFPTTALQVGSRLRFVLAISKTAAGTATSTIDFAVGTAGTTADTARLSFTKPSGTAAVDTGHIILNVVVRAIGASAILVGTISLIANNTNSGLLQNQETYVETVVSSAFNITTATNMGICYTSGASEVLTIDLVIADTTNFI